MIVSASYLTSRPDEDDMLLAAVHRGPFEVRVVENGTLQALRSVTYSSTIPGSQAKILHLVPEGTNVNTGDVLVQFDPQPFAEEVERTTAQLAQAEAELVKAREELKLQRIATTDEIAEARDNVRLAELELKSTVDGQGKVQEAESAADLAQARRELEKAESSYEDLVPLLDEGFITKLELDRAKQAVDKAKEDLKLLEIKHATYMEYTRPAEIEGARARLGYGKESLRQTERAGTYRLSQAEAALKLAQSKQEELRARLQMHQENLSRCEIRASVSGLVIYKEVFFGSEKRKVQIGDQLWPNQPIIMLPDLSQLTVETAVRETDIYKVEKNQHVAISVDAYPDLALSGEVSFIGTLAMEAQSRAGKYFSVSILVKDADPRLRPGMSARVELLVERLEDTLYVPVEAVFERGGRQFAYVLRDGRPQRQELLVGPSNENHIVVETGLVEGEKVLLRDPDDSGVPSEGPTDFFDVLAPEQEQTSRAPGASRDGPAPEAPVSTSP
jgi:HlyD family secretion protein